MRPLQLRAVLPITLVGLFVSLVIMGSFATSASAQAGGPTIVLSSAVTSPTNANSIAITATFSEAVSGFTPSDIVAGSSTVSNFATTSASVYTFNINPTSQGQVTVMVPADTAAATATGFLTNQVSNTLTFTSDATVPTISSVVVSPTTSSATITWNTSEPASGQVAFGLTSSYTSSSTLVTALSTTHTATLTGLTAGTLYHFQIKSTDGASNMATTSDATFTTTAAPITTAPVISNVSASSTGISTANVTWNTDSAATSQVFFGTSASLGSSTTLNPIMSTTHSVALSGLTEATLYHYVVVSTNAIGMSTSSDQVFTSDSTASTTPLAVTGVDSINSTATADGTFVHGFKWVLHFVVPSNEKNFSMKFADFTTPSSSGTIPVAGNVRYYSSQSSNAATEGTAIVETNNNYGLALTLTGDTSASTVGRQVDITVEAAVPTGTPTGVYSTTFGALSLSTTTTP